MPHELKKILDPRLTGRRLLSPLSRRAFLGQALALGVAAVALQGGYQPAMASEQVVPIKGGLLKIGMQGGDFSNKIHAASAVAPVPMFCLRCMGEPLVEVAEDGSLAPRLAAEFSGREGGKIWEFRLRQGVLFSDGTPVRAEDARATLDFHRKPETASVVACLLTGIETMEVIGDTLRVTLVAPNYEFPAALGDQRLSIQPEGKLGSAIFAGGYVLKTAEAGVRHLLERNPHFWDSTRAHVDQIEILVINDTTLRMQNLSTGLVHLVNRADPRKLGALQAQPEIVLARGTAAQAPAFVMQHNAQPYESAELRLALKHAIDRDSILENVFMGQGVISHDAPVAAGWSGAEQRSFDLDRASWHYRNSMHGDAPIILRVTDMAYVGAVDAAQSLQATANAAGIPLELRREEAETYWPEVWNRQPFAASLLPDAANVGLALAAFGSMSGFNQIRFASERYDQLLNDANASADAALRAEMQAEMAQILDTEGGLIIPSRTDALDLHHSRLGGYVPSTRGELMGGYAGLKTWLAA